MSNNSIVPFFCRQIRRHNTSCIIRFLIFYLNQNLQVITAWIHISFNLTLYKFNPDANGAPKWLAVIFNSL